MTLEASPSLNKYEHDLVAPYWAAGLFLLVVCGVSTIWLDLGAFSKSYVVDMTGPAWNYILFRGRFTTQADNAWTRFFTPVKTFTIFVLVCFGIEAAQYLGLYDSTYDSWDLLAYVSILTPLFLLDRWQSRQ